MEEHETSYPDAGHQTATIDNSSVSAIGHETTGGSSLTAFRDLHDETNEAISVNSTSSTWSPDRKNTRLLDVDSNLHASSDNTSTVSVGPEGLTEKAEAGIATLSTETTTTQDSSIECTDDHSKAIAIAAVTPSETLSTICNASSPGSATTTTTVDHSAAASERPGVSLDIALPWESSRESSSKTAGSSRSPGAKMVVGEYVLQTLFVDFANKVEKKVDAVLAEPLGRPLSKSFQRGEDPQFDQLVSCFHAVAEHALPALLRTLFAWYDRQNVDYPNVNVPPETHKQKAEGSKTGSGSTKSIEMMEKEHLVNKRNLAVDYLFALVLIELLKQLPFHPGHEHIVMQVESLAFRHFKYCDPIIVGPNSVNFHIVSDLYAEVIGVLAQSRFQSVRRRFMGELKELRFKEVTPAVAHNIIALLMGMKFFRVKMVPIEDFEASFQFMQECATYFLEVKDRDVKHATTGLLVEILMPVAACVKNEVNVPVLKNFVEMLYPTTLDMCAKKKHVLALFPLVTCLLCVSHKQFFLHNWHHFLTLCLSNLKNRDPKMSRVAVESLYRLLWVYMVRIKCESNSVTQSRLQSIVNSLFPKGSKVVVPRDTPLNIFVKIIQFIAQERMDFAMKEIVFELLSVGRPIRLLMPERMSIGLRAFLVIADNLQQKEGEPPMPRSLGVLPSGNTIRTKKTYVCKVLTDEEAKAIGVSNYYPAIRKTFEEILRLLDAQVGRTMMLTANLNQSKETDEHLIAERKPKVDFLKTCVAAIPRLLPESMTINDLLALLVRLTVHMDEDLRGLAYQSIQAIIVDFKEHREIALHVFVQFVVSDISDAYPSLVDTSLRMLSQFMAAWRGALGSSVIAPRNVNFRHSGDESRHTAVTLAMVLYEIESLGLVMLCHCRFTARRLGLLLLKEAKALREHVFMENAIALPKCFGEQSSLLDTLDASCKNVVLEHCGSLLPPSEKALLSPSVVVDTQWVVDRAASVWNAGFADSNVPLMVQDVAGIVKSFSSPSNNCEIWTQFISGIMTRKGFLGQCPTAVLAYAWPMAYSRIQAVLTLIDPGPVNENRVSLLKTVRQVLTERDLYNNLWKNYLILACSMLPPHSIFSGNIRCISPDIALSTSSSDSNCSEKSENRYAAAQVPAVTAHGFYKMAVRLLRSEAAELSDMIVSGLGKTNPDALKDLLEELSPLIKEAIDRKQENVRRKKRKDALRLELAKLFYYLVREDSIADSSLCISSENSIVFVPTFSEYIEGTRMYLETETDKDNAAVLALIQLYFCKFITGLVRSFYIEYREHLLSVSTRQLIFNLCAGWTGKYGQVFKDANKHGAATASSELEVEALKTMAAVLCCGKVFDKAFLLEDSSLLRWMDLLLVSHDLRIQSLAQETVTLLLCMNSDSPVVLEWVVDRCFTASDGVADRCFHAIASVFCSREYPCDQYSSIINLALMNTGCPRAQVQEVALELLQILDKRFFGQLPVYGSPERPANSSSQRSTLNDVLLSGGNYTRNQLYLSEQLAKLHPDLTMPIFSEITYRFQTARPAVRHNLLTYMIPWLYNLELVDFSTQEPSADVDANAHVVRGQGWGSPEATEMVVNNLMYITAIFGDDLPRELEQVWSSICCAWPNNLDVVLKYLVIVSSLSSSHILPVAKRIVRYMAKARPERLVDHLMDDLQAVDNLCTSVEKTQTPPFFRITSIRRLPVSGGASDKKGDEYTSGTIHTKRHTQNDSADGPRRSSGNASGTRNGLIFHDENGTSISPQQSSKLHPLPMPEYGGHFSPVGDLLYEASASISTMHKCSFAIAFLGDLLLDGINVAWMVHLPVMLHIAVLGLDSQRYHVYHHCRKLLENLLVVFAAHNDHCAVAKLLLEKKSAIATNKSSVMNTSCASSMRTVYRSDSAEDIMQDDNYLSVSTSTLHVSDPSRSHHSISINTEKTVADLINFLASHNSGPLWSFEEITAKQWTSKSAMELTRFVQCLSRIFHDSVPLTRVTQRWAEVAFQYGLSSSSRHYAGRSLQIFRALEVPLTFQVLADLLSRLVETVTEPGDDLQGYVTELVLTLNTCTSTLGNAEETVHAAEENTSPQEKQTTPKSEKSKQGHCRTTSCNLVGSGDFDYRQRSVSDSASHIHRTYSTQTLVNSPSLTSEVAQSLDDKQSLLALLFWISMSILESDYEHEFLLALRLMENVLSKLQLDKADCQERILKVKTLAKWNSFPGVHALVLKGCTSANTFEPTLQGLNRFIGGFENPIVDPNRICFPLNVLAFLPYHLAHFGNPNSLCLESTERIAETCKHISPNLESLSTVMMLYNKGAFTKDAHQWGRCVVKYLFDVYPNLTNILVTFLIEMLEKGPVTLQSQIVNVMHYVLHYVDINSVSSSITAELLRVVTSLMDGPNWRECQNIIKLAVIRSSTILPAGINIGAQHSSITFEPLNSMSAAHFAETDMVIKKELPGRTLDFDFDVSLTPIAGKQVVRRENTIEADLAEVFVDVPRRRKDGEPEPAGWKKPSVTQSRTREHLVGLLAVCGQQAAIPKSPSIVFNEFGDVEEASRSYSSDDATSTIIGKGENHHRGSIVGENSIRDDRSASENTFTVFKDFDFLEYELDSGENESIDNFNWGVRRSLSSVQDTPVSERPVIIPQFRESTEVQDAKKEPESSDDELGSVEIVEMLHEESSVDPAEGEILSDTCTTPTDKDMDRRYDDGDKAGNSRRFLAEC